MEIKPDTAVQASADRQKTRDPRRGIEDLRTGGLLSRRLPGYEERPAQIAMATMVAEAIERNVPAVLEAGTGTGKALDVETPIPTPTGWKCMGDLTTSDFVFDETGSPTRVTAAFSTMYDHKCYEVTFSDGSSLIADAEHEWITYTCIDRRRIGQQRSDTYKAKNFVSSDQLTMLDQLIALSMNNTSLSVPEAESLIGGHQWSLYQASHQIEPINHNQLPVRYPRLDLLLSVRRCLARDLDRQRRDNRAYTQVTTEQIAATLTVHKSTVRANHAILVADALTLPEAVLLIDPYFLGVWLGDGSSNGNQIKSADPDLIHEIEKAGYTVRSLSSNPYLYAVDDENGKAINRWKTGMTSRLRTLGVLQNKHIPTVYLRASEQQRRALLAGLLDTDGTVNRNGAIEFTSTNPQLAQDVRELACSLGFRPALYEGRARLKGKDCGPKWTLAFTTDQQVFRLARKVTAHKERLRNYTPKRNCFRYIINVQEVSSRPVRCIQVEAPSHLYLAGRSMIPTHNSLSYLLPIIRSGKVAIVSTANKALQEQLFYKDIPFLQKHIHFEAAMVKGVSNYACLDRLEQERVGLQFYAQDEGFKKLVRKTQEPVTQFNGDFETLDFRLPGEIMHAVQVDSNQCSWSECAFFDDCYISHMREQAEAAQIIVVNHTLLLLDAAMGEGTLLPARDVIVLDEAHNLEDEATRAFTETVRLGQIEALLRLRRLVAHTPEKLRNEALKQAVATWNRLDAITSRDASGRVPLTSPLEEGLHLASAIKELATLLERKKSNDMEKKEAILYDKLLKQTKHLGDQLRLIFSVAERDTYVYYIERSASGSGAGRPIEQRLYACAAPLDVSKQLHEKLFSMSNVICTSATLATVDLTTRKHGEKDPTFAYFRRRVGLGLDQYPDALECILPLAFDYEHHSLLYLPTSLPQPSYSGSASEDEYIKAIAREMYRLVKLSRGRAFLLFSSKRVLERAYELMQPHLDFPLLKQGDMTRPELVRHFREEPSVLFGLKSFWEGVDIAGEALSLVVVDKLPFEPPNDPVNEARVERMKAVGENWFGTYTLPQAVLRLKQGLGRLLRSRQDRGVMAILDTRLHTKGYGNLVINALPNSKRTSSIKDVQNFFMVSDVTPKR